MKTFGSLGCGNMGGAILNGVGKLNQFKILGFDLYKANLEKLNKSCGLIASDSEIELAKESDIILIAVKPDTVEAVVEKIAPYLTKDKIIVSLAAGVSLERIKKYSNNVCPVVVIMPNTPAMVGKGCVALCFDDPALSEDMKKEIFELFSAISTTVVLKEPQLNEFSALIGSGPAFVFLMLEAMVDVGIRLGFSYDQAKMLVEKLVEGSVNLAQASPDIPHAKLRMNVCSPKGSSIVGVHALERNGVRSGIIDAILETHQRAMEMASGK